MNITWNETIKAADQLTEQLGGSNGPVGPCKKLKEIKEGCIRKIYSENRTMWDAFNDGVSLCRSCEAYALACELSASLRRAAQTQ